MATITIQRKRTREELEKKIASLEAKLEIAQGKINAVRAYADSKANSTMPMCSQNGVFREIKKALGEDPTLF